MKAILLAILFLGASNMANATCSELYNHQLTTLQGDKINLCDYQNKPILVVNTASKCGFTPQFDALEGLYSKYKSKGLLVVGFPSNDFKQEPGNDKQIGDFCKLTYSVKFPMMTKSSVTGANANPFYKQLIAKTGQQPQWNFYKYVILPGGKDVYAFSSDVKPDSAEILDRIKSGLK
ncbi:MAG: glutathione peroxidase [Methylotenera sp.]|uniref:glutathione peroxidase n=2 Tax=Methylotenera sp. TaxID=2051956 RepID=UPI002723381E|nr:glutathione peroxidase [Methylotenera sp.]MDO9204509.1 glutathione peroxidase [Methylotenera sp.]MDO9394417.1 glutathione peroxidase [Methylotenera sp.]MDP1521878.1 glutathione peroxidase [Methylotenera sp.]MDP2072106.1 glutathione peroxidase [Methylotenera sp.]MDP2230682.1 glutathione peroxidase [Methylotenera sp.]